MYYKSYVYTLGLITSFGAKNIKLFIDPCKIPCCIITQVVYHNMKQLPAVKLMCFI